MNQVLDNPVKNQTLTSHAHLDSHEKSISGSASDFNALVIVAALMVTTYLTANIMAVKLITLFGLTLFDAGTITFPIAYMLGDVVTEIWGFRTSKKLIWLTFACNLLLVLATTIGIFLPSPDYMASISNAYASIFTVVPRILAASLTAFLAGELVNARIMEWMKNSIRFGSAPLWTRTVGSSVIGYLFDTVLFVIIAFAGTAPVRDLITMMAAQYLAKVLIEAVGGTPLAYAAIGLLKRRCEA